MDLNHAMLDDLAQKAQACRGSDGKYRLGSPEMATFHTAAHPAVVLALVARVRALEAERDQIKADVEEMRVQGAQLIADNMALEYALSEGAHVGAGTVGQ